MRRRTKFTITLGIAALLCFLLTPVLLAVDWTSIVWRDKTRHFGFPSAASLRNGDLMAVFREGKSSLDPTGRIVAVKSLDKGHTWKIKTFQVVYDSNLDDRDPSITTLKDGTIIVNFTRYSYTKIAGKSTLANSVEGVYLIKSLDGGKTWSKPAAIKTHGYQWAAASEPVMELEDGMLLMPLYGLEKSSNSEIAFLLRSHDRGKTWGEPGVIARNPFGTLKFQEPSLAVLPSGEIFAAFGAQGGHGTIHVSRSSDNGRTWSQPKDTGIVGVSPSLLTLSDGQLLMTYGYKQQPVGIRTIASQDGGNTWNPGSFLVLHCGAQSLDAGAPSVVETSPGHVVAVYYFTDNVSTYIEAAGFRP